jgi:hypothetical protein
MSGIHMALMGSSADAVISITDQTISSLVFPPNTAEAGYRLGADGKVYKYVTGVFTELETWCTPTTSASNYEARVTINSGSTPTGSVGSWVALSSTRDWTISESTSGVNNVSNFTVEIRRVGGTSSLDSATIDLTAGVF